MIEIHTDREGSRQYISQMTDDHLVNTIKLVCQRITSMNTALGATVTVTPLQSALYGVSPQALTDQAKDALPSTIRHLYPYLAEACLRGLPEATEAIRQALGRTTAELPLPVALDPAPRAHRRKHRLLDARLEDGIDQDW